MPRMNIQALTVDSVEWAVRTRRASESIAAGDAVPQLLTQGLLTSR
jgi:hypothetical protein